MNQNLSIGLQAGSPARARVARPDSCQLTSTCDSPPGQLHVGGPARASAPAPAEPRSRSLRRSHPCAVMDRQACFLLPLSPSHVSSTRNSGERRPVQDWSSQILEAASVSQPSPVAPARVVASDRFEALHCGRRSDSPAGCTGRPALSATLQKDPAGRTSRAAKGAGRAPLTDSSLRRASEGPGTAHRARRIRGSCGPDGVRPLPGPAGCRGERASGCGAALARGCAAWLSGDRRHGAAELLETPALVASDSQHHSACSFRKQLPGCAHPVWQPSYHGGPRSPCGLPD